MAPPLSPWSWGLKMGCEIVHPMVKSAARFGAPKPSYGHFSHPAGHGRGKFSSRKTPKMAINHDFPGLRAFSANLRETKLKSAKFRNRWSKVPRVLGPLNRLMAILVTRPATAGGSFQAEKNPKWQFGICMKMRDIYCRLNGTDPDMPQVVQAVDGMCMTNRRLWEG